MKSRRRVVCLGVLFALTLGALSAASAAATGTTAYTCVPEGNGAYFGGHCLATGSVPHDLKEIPVNTLTTVTATNQDTASETTAARSETIKGTISGINTEITCNEEHGEGTLENKTVSGEMVVAGEVLWHFTICEVKAPAGKGCKVSGGTFTTSQLTSTTQGQGDGVKFAPKEGTKIADIKIEGCSVAALNNTFPLTGSFVAQTSGATQASTHVEVTTQNTLKLGGQKAGFEGAITTEGHSAGEETHPIFQGTS
ncbi:MAG TPA: hypothetical protein VFJ57_09150 [Solirubrobacterales bacterium]|nr:hypothetical protein [Solirubrobacterales bacterium]